MINEIQAKSILRKHKKIDSWFMSRYGMNLYRGCQHDCVYCDGRAEGYYVEGEFGRDIDVKVNSPELLACELDPARKRTPMKKGIIMVGGGVGDSYQLVEEKCQLTRRILELLYGKGYPVHILTKSVLIERDFDILDKINRQSQALISMSFSSADDTISRYFEPGVPASSRRLDTLKRLKDRGFTCGIFLMPVIPYITDTAEKMEEVLSAAKSAGIDYIIFSGMTLKEGRQKGYFMNMLQNYNPSLIPKYLSLYRGDKWGGANWDYYESIHKTFYTLAMQYKISIRIPVTAVKNFIDEDDRVIAMLEQMDYLLKYRNIKSPYGAAARSLSELKEPLRDYLNRGTSLNDNGTDAEKAILSILPNGTCDLYERLISFTPLE